jgi:type III pantothenate kinase
MGLRQAEAPRLVLDIGNTTTTIAVFRDSPDPLVERLSSSVFADPAVVAETFGKLSADYGPFCEAAICSVVPDIAARCADVIGSVLALPVLTIGSGLSLPFTLRYENSHAFGADRIALCAWSASLFPNKAHIAVDIGTAITFDVLDSKGEYVGGLIMPGLDVMSGALHSRTAQLPLVTIDRRTALLGRSTGECIRSGIFWGTVKQVEGLIDEIGGYLLGELGEAEVGVIATGGNSRLIAGEIDTIDVVDELAVVRGIRLLLEMNPPGKQEMDEEDEV